MSLTYPLLGSLPGLELPAQFQPIWALPESRVPLLLTKVGREAPEIAEAVAAFVSAAEASGSRLEVIDVPNGQHGFESVDHDEDSRRAVREALTWVTSELHAR